MVLRGPGWRGLQISLSIFCYIVTLLQKAENPYRERLSAVTESVTQPCRLRYKPTGHGDLLRFFGRFAGKNLKKINPEFRL